MSSHEGANDPEIYGPPDDAAEPVANPGEPPHEPRLTDIDERAAKRAERQIAAMFGAAGLLVVAFSVLYVVVPPHATILGLGAQNIALGGTLGFALLLIGLGTIQWSRKLMDDTEFVEERHPARSTDEDREAAAGVLVQGGRASKLGERKLLRRSMIGALGLLGIPPILLLGDLGPLPGNKLAHTIWKRRIRVVNDVTMEPIKPEDLQLGQLVNAVPESLAELHHEEYLNAKAKAAVLLIRMHPDDIRSIPKRRDWTIDGIICYSKICTHVGCPVNLYERQTHKALCPCHQSTFDLADNGRVVFGPAARGLPQLPLMLDEDGYIVAQSDFTEPVGPTYWGRKDDV